MPQLRKLAPEEVQVIEDKGKGPRKLAEEQYDAFLSEYELGDYGEAELDEGEQRLNVRNRLRAAAGRRGIGVDFRRTQGNFIQFQIVAPGSESGKRKAAVVPAVVAPEPPAAPAKRKGGRPKKATT